LFRWLRRAASGWQRLRRVRDPYRLAYRCVRAEFARDPSPASRSPATSPGSAESWTEAREPAPRRAPPASSPSLTMARGRTTCRISPARPASARALTRRTAQRACLGPCSPLSAATFRSGRPGSERARPGDQAPYGNRPHQGGAVLAQRTIAPAPPTPRAAPQPKASPRNPERRTAIKSRAALALNPEHASVLDEPEVLLPAIVKQRRLTSPRPGRSCTVAQHATFNHQLAL
jgi:hypothetical protein